MTDQEIRIAVAEACGWKIITEDDGGITGFCVAPPRGPDTIPDYPNDLNAMHAAEKVLTPEQALQYGNLVIEIADRDFGPSAEYSRAGTFHIIHATARQRAEALLQTLGKTIS